MAGTFLSTEHRLIISASQGLCEAVTVTISTSWVKKLRLEEVTQIFLGTREGQSWGSEHTRPTRGPVFLTAVLHVARKLSKV